MIRVEYDSAYDQLYISFQETRPGIAAETVEIDDRRRVDFTADGGLYGIEIDQPSLGVDLEGLPEAQAVAQALERLAVQHGWARV